MKTISNSNKAYNIFKATLLLLFVLNTTISFGQKGCRAEFKVEHDRNARSVTPDGTYYKMEISNFGASSDSYILSSLDVNKSCSNPDGSLTAMNVFLNIEFLDKSLKPIKEIKVNAGETVTFFAYVTVPKGTPFDKWSCIQVIAKSKVCPNSNMDTILHTLVINSNRDN